MKLDFWTALTYAILTLAAFLFGLKDNEAFNYIRLTVGSALAVIVVFKGIFVRSLE